MTKTLKTAGVVCLTVAFLSLGACAPAEKHDRIAQAPTGMHEIAALYEKATEPHRRAVRRPVRDYRARALNALAEKADQLVTETEGWDSDTRLISIDAAQRDEVRGTVGDFRSALRQISDAAQRSDTSDLRKSYDNALASYQHLLTITNTLN